MQLVQSIQDLFSAIEGKEVATQDRVSVMLVLGPSVARPKEIYHLIGIASAAHDYR